MTAWRFAALASTLWIAGCAAPDAPPSASVPATVVPRMPLPVTAPAVPTVIAADFALDRPAVQGALLRGRAPTGTRTLRLGDAAVAVAADGAFVVGIDRDAPPELVLEAVLADGTIARRTLAIAKGSWRIEAVNASPTGGVSSDRFAAVRPGELARIAAARAERGDSQGWRQSFIWPAAGRVSGMFGSQRVYRGTPGAYHAGLDIAGGAGATYRAPADGTVVLAAETPFSLEGYLLIIDHGHGLNSAFLHSARLFVRPGQRVRQGEPLGTIGATGRASGPHLHWALKWEEARIDPLPLLPPR